MSVLTEANLSQLGVSEHIPSLAEVAQDFKRKESVAFCSSNWCTRGRSPLVQKPYVKKNQTMCECGSALFWKMITRTD